MQFPFGPDSNDENDKKNKNSGDSERGKRVNPLSNPFLVRAMEQRAESKGAALEGEPMGAMDLSMKMGRRLLDQARKKEGPLGERLRGEMETAGFSFGPRGAIGFKDPKERTRGGDGRQPGQGSQTQGGDGRQPGQGSQTQGGDDNPTSIALTPGRGAKRQEGQPMQTTEMVRRALMRPFGGEGARSQGDPLAFLNARLPDTDEDDLLEAEGLISAAETTLAEQSANADDPLTAKLIATRAEEAKSMMAALAGEKAIRETSVPSSSFETVTASPPQDEEESNGSKTPHPEERRSLVSKGEEEDTPATEALLEGVERARQAGPADSIQLARADTGIQNDAETPAGQQAQSEGAKPESTHQVAQAIPPSVAPPGLPRDKPRPSQHSNNPATGVQAGPQGDIMLQFQNSDPESIETIGRPKSLPQNFDEQRATQTFQRYRNNLKPVEGGFANDSSDSGGPTQKGFSQITLNGLKARDPELWGHLPAQSKNLTDPEIDAVFRIEFYNKPKIDLLEQVPGLAQAAPKLAEQVFDSGIQSGPAQAGKFLQEALQEALPGLDLTDSVTDKSGNKSRALTGNIGPATRKAVEEAIKQGLIGQVNNAMVDKRKTFMQDLVKKRPKDQKYLKGWLGRAEDFRGP